MPTRNTQSNASARGDGDVRPDELMMARAAVRSVASHAGDASGSADRALFLIEKCNSPSLVIEALTLARDQARSAAARADEAILDVQKLTD